MTFLETYWRRADDMSRDVLATRGWYILATHRTFARRQYVSRHVTHAHTLSTSMPSSSHAKWIRQTWKYMQKCHREYGKGLHIGACVCDSPVCTQVRVFVTHMCTTWCVCVWLTCVHTGACVCDSPVCNLMRVCVTHVCVWLTCVQRFPVKKLHTCACMCDSFFLVDVWAFLPATYGFLTVCVLLTHTSNCLLVAPSTERKREREKERVCV